MPHQVEATRGSDDPAPSARTHDEAVVKAAQLGVVHQTAYMATAAGWRLQFLEKHPRFMELYRDWDFWYADAEVRLNRFVERRPTLAWSIVAIFMLFVVACVIGVLFIISRFH